MSCLLCILTQTYSAAKRSRVGILLYDHIKCLLTRLVKNVEYHQTKYFRFPFKTFCKYFLCPFLKGKQKMTTNIDLKHFTWTYIAILNLKFPQKFLCLKKWPFKRKHLIICQTVIKGNML